MMTFGRDIVVPRDGSMADTLYERLAEHINEATSALEVGESLQLDWFNSSGECIRVEDIGYHNPNLIKLYGRDNSNRKCTVLVHMNALELVLRVNDSASRQSRRIGFVGESATRN
ncbi:MAG: hypothetical protein KGK07_09860 [Chloroflexota bacterium]|nr:hypothetical protein [Chloroflexota bacterium]